MGAGLNSKFQLYTGNYNHPFKSFVCPGKGGGGCLNSKFQLYTGNYNHPFKSFVCPGKGGGGGGVLIPSSSFILVITIILSNHLFAQGKGGGGCLNSKFQLYTGNYNHPI